MQLLAIPMGIAALCALHRIPSHGALTAHFNDSADQAQKYWNVVENCRLRDGRVALRQQPYRDIHACQDLVSDFHFRCLSELVDAKFDAGL